MNRALPGAGFRPAVSGQNFLTIFAARSDLQASQTGPGDAVLESERGPVTLTLAQPLRRAGDAFEEDQSLAGELWEASEIRRTRPRFEDIWKTVSGNSPTHLGGGPSRWVANLPNYITTPSLNEAAVNGTAIVPSP
jgi:16S rRNA A1518/A1519 N6-dimethyltransferase RsmA/KsgA/DIM1 with predicted DNA glycosylase/AP lyase activity